MIPEYGGFKIIAILWKFTKIVKCAKNLSGS